MARKPISARIKTKMRYLHEVEGLSQAKIADAVGVAIETVRKYMKEDGWGAKGSLAQAPDPSPYDEDTTESVGPVIENTDDNVVQFPQDAAAQITTLQQQLADARAAVQQAEGKVLLPFIETADGAYTDKGAPNPKHPLWYYVTPQSLEARVEGRIYQEQNRRAGRGFAIIDPDSDRWRGMFQAYLREAIQEAVDGQTKWAATQLLGAAPPLKKVTMCRRRPDGTYETRDIPYRADINSPSGNPADGVRKQQGKGWAVADPFRCMTQNCYRYAAVNDSGDFVHNGFCDSHRAWNVEERIRPDTTGTHLSSSLRKVDWR